MELRLLYDLCGKADLRGGKSHPSRYSKGGGGGGVTGGNQLSPPVSLLLPLVAFLIVSCLPSVFY